MDEDEDLVENEDSDENEEGAPTFELNLHWKQGDEFHSFLEAGNNVVSNGLELWSLQLQKNSEKCLKIANKLKGLNITGFGDTHMIMLVPQDEAATKALEELVIAKLLEKTETE